MKKNYGIDLLKLLSMFMVVVLHMIVNSGLLSENNILTVPGELTWLIWTFCFCAVICFAIISGYVGYNTKHKISKLIYLWLVVEFYTVVLGLIQMVFVEKNLTLGGIIDLAFPTFTRKYWYFSEYVLLFVFMPALDSIIDNLPRNKCRNILVASIFIISICLKLIANNDFLELGHGCSTLWLSILYCLGAYIKKYAPLSSLSNASLLILTLLMPLISWFWQLLCRLLFSGYSVMNTLQYFFYSRHTSLISYLSITMVLQASLMVILCQRFSFKEKIINILNTLKPLSFGVYIMHTTSFFFSNINNPLGQAIASLESPLKPILFVVAALFVCILCLGIDYLRNIIFIRLTIKKHVDKCCNYLSNIADK